MAVATDGTKVQKFLANIRDLFVGLGEEEPVKKLWDVSNVRELGKRPGPLGPREKRMMCLFADGPRTVISGKELGEKFGCSVPLDFASDMRGLSAFCTEKNLPVPLTASGTGADTVYRLSWDYKLMSAFVATVGSV